MPEMMFHRWRPLFFTKGMSKNYLKLKNFSPKSVAPTCWCKAVLIIVFNFLSPENNNNNFLKAVAKAPMYSLFMKSYHFWLLNIFFNLDVHIHFKKRKETLFLNISTDNCQLNSGVLFVALLLELFSSY